MVDARKGQSKIGGKKERKKRFRNWAELYGLGKGLWKGEDAQAYLNRLRGDRV